MLCKKDKIKSKKKCLDFSIQHFRMVGCWPCWKKRNQWSERLYVFYTGFVFVSQLLKVLIVIFGLFLHCKKWKTLEEGVEEVVVCLTVSIVLVKMFLILRHQEVFEEFHKNINRNLSNPDFMGGVSDSIVESCVRHEKRLVIYYSIFGYTVAFLYTASSLVANFRAMRSDEYVLPLKYPFKPNGFYFYITFLYQLVSMITCGHIGTMFDSIFSCIAFYIAEQFEILKRRAENKSEIMSKKFVIHHNSVISLVRKLETIYRNFMAFEFTVTSALLCLGMVQLTQTKNIHLLYYIKCIVYVIGKLNQMVLYCWYGDRIIQKSTSISYGAYFGTWYADRNKKMTSHLTMIMLRSQKPVLISSGFNIKVSLPTMASVIQLAYSFFTMLKSLR